MNICIDNYGYMRYRKTSKIYDWQVKDSECICTVIKYIL